MSKKFKFLLTTFLILGSLYFLFIGLSSGKGFLIPLTTAIILSMVMNPVAALFRKWGIGKGWAVFLADFVIVLFLGFMMFLLIGQANNVAKNWPQIQKSLKPKIEQAQKFLSEKLNMQPFGQSQQGQGSGSQGQDQQGQTGQQDGQTGEGQNQADQSSQSSGEGQSGLSGLLSGNNLQSMLSGIAGNVFGFLSDLLLMLVYIFFFMYYQHKFERALIGFAPDERKEQVKDIINKSAQTAQKYLFGRFILILILALLYLAGFSIVGLKHALFISLIAALFSLIPYVGNIIGLALAIAMSFLSQGDAGQIIGILIVFSIAQFIESYLLEPFIVGAEVDLNPVIVIVGVVLGGIVWGVMGMILAIPLLGICKVVCDNVDEFKPLGYALNEKDISSGDGFAEKIKSWAQGIFKK